MASEMKKNHRARAVIGTALSGLMAACILLQPALNVTPAVATDLNQPITDTDAGPVDAGNQFVKLGLNKSIIVRLPAEARDVVVGDPEIIDAVVRRKNMAYIFARQIGQSNIFFFDANGEQILALDVEVAVDSLALKKLLNRALPGNKLTVDTVNTDVVLGGTARNNLEAKTALDVATRFVLKVPTATVINTVQVAGEDQVMLKVRVVEMQRNILKQLGIDLQAALRSGQELIQVANINPWSISDLTNGGDSGISYFDTEGTNGTGAILRALETDGLARTLAEPNLTALTGQEAKFRAGGDIPYRTCDTERVIGAPIRSSADCTVEFREVGVSLSFVPTVLGNNRINLKLSTEVSELGQLIDGIPAVDTRSAESTVELPDGGSMMVAGLIKETTRQNTNGFPGLKKLPVLGALFRSREFQANETELVVIITPYVVNPVAQSKLTTPDKNFSPATEAQSLFFGKLNKNFKPNGKRPSGKYNGNVGFIVE
jgi:pilus assembly protein CpaC